MARLEDAINQAIDSGRFSDLLREVLDAADRDGRCAITGRRVPPPTYDAHVMTWRVAMRIRARRKAMQR